MPFLLYIESQIFQVITDVEVEKNLNIKGKIQIDKQNVKKIEKPTQVSATEARLRQTEGRSSNFVQPVAEGRMRMQENR